MAGPAHFEYWPVWVYRLVIVSLAKIFKVQLLQRSNGDVWPTAEEWLLQIRQRC
jgi:hypothetical protein